MNHIVMLSMLLVAGCQMRTEPTEEDVGRSSSNLYFTGAVLWGRFSVFSNANKIHAFPPFVNIPHGLPNVYGGFRHKKTRLTRETGLLSSSSP